MATSSKIDKKDKRPKQRKEEKSAKSPRGNDTTNKAEKAKLKRKVFGSESEPEDVGQPKTVHSPDSRNKRKGRGNPATVPNKRRCQQQCKSRRTKNSHTRKRRDPKPPNIWNSEVGKARSSARVSKKPHRWGHNVMVTKIEAASCVEEERKPPKCIRNPW